MSQGLTILAAVLVLADLAFCFGVGLKTRAAPAPRRNTLSATKRSDPVLLFLTAWASFSGAGNFIGQAGRGAMEGISAYWLWLGEGFLGGIIMGYILAPYLARFKYHLHAPLYLRLSVRGRSPDPPGRGAVAALMPNVVWPGAQIMGVAYVLELVFGIDYRIAVIVCGVIFVFYTVSGGLKAVVYADAFHGTIQLIFAVVIIIFGLKLLILISAT